MHLLGKRGLLDESGQGAEFKMPTFGEEGNAKMQVGAISCSEYGNKETPRKMSCDQMHPFRKFWQKIPFKK